MTQTGIFDGHNDVLLRLWEGGRDSEAGFGAGSGGHIDLPRAQKGGMIGGFFACFVPGDAEFNMSDLAHAEYDLPKPDPLTHAEGLRVTIEQAAILHRLEARGDLVVCRSVADIRATVAAGKFAAILHIEGAEAIAKDLSALEVLYEAGLRSVGPVWSRDTIFGTGVPMRFPGHPDVGPGLTDAGKALVQRCSALGMVVDTSHLNEAGFWDIAELGVPLVATHSNAHAVCQTARNLTDRQLKAIGETGGVVGLNYATAFLRPDGQMVAEGAMEWMIPHLDHMLQHAGEDHVALGSDFDGAMVPKEIGDAAGLDALREAMVQAGYGDALITKICHENWFAGLERIWGG